MQWLQLGLTVLSILSSIASICGLYYALRSVRESKEQTTKLKDLVERQTISQTALIHVSKSLTTRYAGIHPEYITEVQKVVDSAKESILVKCHPCRASASSPRCEDGKNSVRD